MSRLPDPRRSVPRIRAAIEPQERRADQRCAPLRLFLYRISTTGKSRFRPAIGAPAADVMPPDTARLNAPSSEKPDRKGFVAMPLQQTCMVIAVVLRAIRDDMATRSVYAILGAAEEEEKEALEAKLTAVEAPPLDIPEYLAVL
ncbi:hypothetical protein [Oceaniovalibus guishaninsula]|nr:hypothetical protein [Oceaniovalibus guishaninsula]